MRIRVGLLEIWSVLDLGSDVLRFGNGNFHIRNHDLRFHHDFWRNYGFEDDGCYAVLWSDFRLGLRKFPFLISIQILLGKFTIKVMALIKDSYVGELRFKKRQLKGIGYHSLLSRVCLCYSDLGSELRASKCGLAIHYPRLVPFAYSSRFRLVMEWLVDKSYDQRTWSIHVILVLLRQSCVYGISTGWFVVLIGNNYTWTYDFDLIHVLASRFEFFLENSHLFHLKSFLESLEVLSPLDLGIFYTDLLSVSSFTPIVDQTKSGDASRSCVWFVYMVKDDLNDLWFSGWQVYSHNIRSKI